MVNSKPFQISLVLACAVGFGQATQSYSIHFNGSISSTQSTPSPTPPALFPSTTAITSPGGQITQCAITGNIDFRWFLSEEVQALPIPQQLVIFSSVFTKYSSFLETIENLAAKTATLDPAGQQKFLNNVFSTLKYDITSLFGQAGDAIVKFADLATEGCLFQTCFFQYFEQSSTFVVNNPGASFVYSASAPCCDRCKITARRVDLEYWPTPAVDPAISTLINESENLTFVSPSVYARYTDISAQDLCGPVGRTVGFTRIPFNPDALSTSSLSFDSQFVDVAPDLGSWTKINYADFDSPACLCTTNCFVDPVDNITSTYRCTPRLSVPAEVTALDPAWATCREDLFGFFDPPIALPRAKGLTGPRPVSASSTPAGPVTSPTPTVPAPQDSPLPPNVPETPGPVVLPTPTIPVPDGGPSSPTVPDIPEPSPDSERLSTTTPVRQTDTIPVGDLNTDLEVPSSASNAPLENPNQPTTNPTIPIQSANGSPIPVPSQGNGNSVAVTASIPAGLPNASSEPATPELITFDGEILTANPESNFVIGTQTLTPGAPAMTVSGSVISLAPGASELSIAAPTTELGSLIGSFVGETGIPTSTSLSGGNASSTAPAEFEGESRRENASISGLCFAIFFSGLMNWF